MLGTGLRSSPDGASAPRAVRRVGKRAERAPAVEGKNKKGRLPPFRACPRGTRSLSQRAESREARAP